MSKVSLLEQYLLDTRDAKFDWARMNCCHFVARWVEIATGRNPMAGLRATASQHAAHRLITELGGSMVTVWAGFMNASPRPPAYAVEGDVVLMRLPQGSAAGICVGRDAVLLTLEDGLSRFPMTHATHTWAIPR